MSDIPAVREWLISHEEWLKRNGFSAQAREARFMVEQTKRAKYLRKSDMMHTPDWKTPQVVKQVRQLRKAGCSYRTILTVVKEVPNIGRVSEICRG